MLLSCLRKISIENKQEKQWNEDEEKSEKTLEHEKDRDSEKNVNSLQQFSI